MSFEDLSAECLCLWKFVERSALRKQEDLVPQARVTWNEAEVSKSLIGLMLNTVSTTWGAAHIPFKLSLKTAVLGQ